MTVKRKSMAMHNNPLKPGNHPGKVSGRKRVVPRKGRIPTYRTPTELWWAFEDLQKEYKHAHKTMNYTNVQSRIGLFTNYHFRKRNAKAWDAVIADIKMVIDAQYTERAESGAIPPKIAAMKMVHMEEYAPIRQEISMQSSQKINLEWVGQLAQKIKSGADISVIEKALGISGEDDDDNSGQ